MQRLIPINVGKIKSETERIFNKIEKNSDKAFLYDWNVIVPSFLYEIDMLEMVLGKLAKAISLSLDLGISAGFALGPAVNGKIGTSEINIGDVFLDVLLGTPLSAVSKTLNLANTYVKRFS